MALRDDFQYTAAERLNRYCITSPAGKPLNQQIGLWIDMLQSLLDTELVLLLEENNQKDRIARHCSYPLSRFITGSMKSTIP